MNVERKTNLILGTGLLNAVLLCGLFGVHVIERRDIAALFNARIQVEDSTREYLRLANQLQEERWTYLMSRLDSIDAKIERELR